MGKNEQIQGQELNVDAATIIQRIECLWYKPIKTSTIEMDRTRMDASPSFSISVNVLLYRGNVSRVICPYLLKGKCTSASKKRDECYFLDEAKTE